MNNGARIWREHPQGKLHRLSGPAVIEQNGTFEWYRNGERHREDGPAIVLCNGTMIWMQNDDLHRIDGPAIIDPDGSVQYWVEGQKVKPFEGVR